MPLKSCGASQIHEALPFVAIGPGFPNRRAMTLTDPNACLAKTTSPAKEGACVVGRGSCVQSVGPTLAVIDFKDLQLTPTSMALKIMWPV